MSADERLIQHFKDKLLEQGELMTCVIAEGQTSGETPEPALVDCLLAEGVPPDQEEALMLFFGLGRKHAEMLGSLARLHFATEVWMRVYTRDDDEAQSILGAAAHVHDSPAREEGLMVQTLDLDAHEAETKLWRLLRSGAGVDLVPYHLPPDGLGVVSNGPLLEAFALGFLLAGDPDHIQTTREQKLDQMLGLLGKLRFGNVFAEQGGHRVRKRN